MSESYYQRGYLLEDFRLFHLNSAPKESIGFHYHDFHKLLLLLDGQGSYTIAGDRWALSPGDAVFVGSHRVHRPEFDRAYERLIVYIAPDFLRSSSTPDCDLEMLFSSARPPVLHLSDSARQQISHIAAQFEQTLSGTHYGRDIISRSLLLLLLVTLGQAVQDVPLSPASGATDPKCQEIMDYIDQHKTEELSIDAIAAHFFLSKYHMMRLFRQSTGFTVYGYLQEQRLLYARALLAQGLRATTACYQSGFHSYSSFIRAYTKRFGATPTGRRSTGARAEASYE